MEHIFNESSKQICVFNMLGRLLSKKKKLFKVWISISRLFWELRT